MRIGIIGLPLSGKSTVFQILVPGCPLSTDPTRPRLGVTTVPDPRVDFCSGVFKPQKTTFATLEMVDFAGVRAGGVDRGFPPAVVAQMRNAEALMAVVRFFHQPGAEDPTPVKDVRLLMDELVFADLAVTEPRSERILADKKRAGRYDEKELSAVTKVTAVLSEGRPAFRADLTPEERATLKGYGLLTLKPFVVVANCDEDGFRDVDGPVSQALAELSRDYPDYEFMRLSARVEEEIGQLDEADRTAFLEDLGQKEAARDRIIRAAFRLLDLICFITVGEDEVRAWPIRRHTTAVKAAGRIHTDLEQGFIRAEVSSWDDFHRLNGSLNDLKKAGLLRLEGKEYKVADGDVINIRSGL
ncbi:MAG: redox-regulated ATPase YchF [Candidatus Riflebacteria bacterium]|nr:redox-regulated ATPase YchF [Candidatus Riflebacteria bacterium]